MRRLAVAPALLFAGCAQWGTFALRTKEVWWACTPALQDYVQAAVNAERAAARARSRGIDW